MVEESNSKRVAKNTVLLYIRMLFLMIISLYTSRVVLATLGVEDYGLYNVVGGVVSMFTMISGALSASISRYITFELGRGDKESLKRVFSSSVTIQLLLATIFFIVAESIGLWFVNAKLVIPPSRLFAANFVYQFSIITFVLNLISVPYNAEIIAHEKMSVFAYISIFEGIGKLVIAWLITISTSDKLILYSLLVMLIALVVRIVYGFYCKRKFEECTFHFIYDRNLLSRMFGFAGWNLIGATSAVCRDHGGNILINLFCGPAINGARAIAVQVNNIILGFVGNFQTALNPQITKKYASDNLVSMLKMIFQGARFSYYILFLIALPLFVNTEFVLSVWLKEVPDHTTNFLRLVLVFSLIECLSGPLMTAMYATEKIKKYQIIVGGIQLLNLPISYIALRCGFEGECVYVVAITLSLLALFARLLLLKTLIGLSPVAFISDVCLNVLFVSFLSSIIPIIHSYYTTESTWVSFVISCLMCLLISSLCVMFIGCRKGEREMLLSYVRNFIGKMSKKRM